MPITPDHYVEIDHDLTDDLHANTFISKGARGFVGGINLATGESFGCEIAIDPDALKGQKLLKDKARTVTGILDDNGAGGELSAALRGSMINLPDTDIYKSLLEMAEALPDMAAAFSRAAPPVAGKSAAFSGVTFEVGRAR